MRTRDIVHRGARRIAVLALCVAVCGGAVHADVLVLKNGKRVQAAKITYKRSSDEFLVHVGSTQAPYPAANVESVRVARPQQLTSAQQKMQSGDLLSAIAILRDVERDYYKLNWDLEAKALLAQCYFETGEERRAIALCEELAAVPGVRLPGAVNRAYLRALAEQGDLDKVEAQVVRMIQTGSREAAAAAQLMRADILLENDRHEEALVKGYLRTAELFRDIKDVQPEALYGVVVCYRALGETEQAEAFAKRLRERYATSEFAAKLRLLE